MWRLRSRRQTSIYRFLSTVPSPKQWPDGECTHAFAGRSLGQLLRTILVYKACSLKWLASATPMFLSIASSLHLSRAMYWLIKKSIYSQFCGGESVTDVQRVADALKAQNIGIILDYAAEPDISPNRSSSVPSNHDYYEAVKGKVIETIDVASKSNSAIVAVKFSGLLDNKLLERLNQMIHQSPSKAKSLVFGDCGWERLKSICDHAVSMNVKLAIDAEQSFVQDAIDFICLCLMERYNCVARAPEPVIINTYQMYRKDALVRLQEHLLRSKKHPFHFGAKVVRGAYIVGETIWAEEGSYDCPLFSSIEETHRQYNDAISLSYNYIKSSGIHDAEPRKFVFIFATHNRDSLRLAAQLYLKEETNLNKRAKIIFAQLYGMSDAASLSLSEAGYPVFKYLPYGQVKEVIPYLIRRSQENSSIFKLANSDATMMWEEIKSRVKNQWSKLIQRKTTDP